MTRRAFSLIELLVAIAVIAILLALAIPALSSARRASQQTASASNLRQIGVALETYRDANEGFFPYFLPQLGRSEVIGRVTLDEAIAALGLPREVLLAPADPKVRSGEADELFGYSSYAYVPGEVMTWFEFARRSPGEQFRRVRSLYDLRGGTVLIERDEWSDDHPRLEISLPDWSVGPEDTDRERHVTGYTPTY